MQSVPVRPVVIFVALAIALDTVEALSAETAAILAATVTRFEF